MCGIYWCYNYLGNLNGWQKLLHRIFWGVVLLTIGADVVYNVSNRVTSSSLEKNLQSRGAGTFNTIVQLSSVKLGLNSTIIISKYSNYGTSSQNYDLISLLRVMKYTYLFGIAITGFCFILNLFFEGRCCG